MTNDERSSNHQNDELGTANCSLLRHSDFVIPSTFDIGHWSLVIQQRLRLLSSHWTQPCLYSISISSMKPTITLSSTNRHFFSVTLQNPTARAICGKNCESYSHSKSRAAVSFRLCIGSIAKPADWFWRRK